MGNRIDQATQVTWHYIGGRWYWVAPSTSGNTLTVTVRSDSKSSD